MTKLIFLSGSSRKESLNKKLAKIAANLAEDHQDVEAEFIDLADYEMPIYNGDLEDEKGLPENAKKLKQKFIESNGFFIASPEYNSSISSLLKNSLDWISRPSEDGEVPLIAFAGKVAAISSASPGGFGGLRGLVPLRMMLGNIQVTVIPEQVAISAAHKVMDSTGNIEDERTLNMLKNQLSSFVKAAKAFS